jgi:hypothetical protein
MRKLSQLVCSLSIISILSVFAQPACGQSAPVYVSARTGVDGGTCTAAAPCRTVTHALTQVAVHGHILIVDSGDYDPSVVITKSVTISAAPGVAAVFSSGVQFGSIFSLTDGPSFCTSVACHTVALRNLILDGQGVTQDGVRSHLMNLTVEDCVFSRLRFGIYQNGAGSLTIKRSTFRQGEQGLFIAPVGSGKNFRLMVENSLFSDYSAGGINVDANGNNNLWIAVRDTVIDRAGSMGIRSSTALGGGIQFNIERTQITNCGSGLISVAGSSVVRVSNSTIANNTNGLVPAAGGVLLTRGNNTIEGNNFNGNFTGSFSAK